MRRRPLQVTSSQTRYVLPHDVHIHRQVGPSHTKGPACATRHVRIRRQRDLHGSVVGLTVHIQPTTGPRDWLPALHTVSRLWSSMQRPGRPIITLPDVELVRLLANDASLDLPEAIVDWAGEPARLDIDSWVPRAPLRILCALAAPWQSLTAYDLCFTTLHAPEGVHSVQIQAGTEPLDRPASAGAAPLRAPALVLDLELQPSMAAACEPARLRQDLMRELIAAPA